MYAEYLYQGPSGSHLLTLILVVIGAFLLGVLFRYFLNDRLHHRIGRLERERDEALAHKDSVKLREHYEKIIAEKDQKIDRLNLQLSNLTTVNRPTEYKEKNLAVQTNDLNESKPDKLVKIEGVGPKIAEVLVQNGIVSYEILSKTPSEEIRRILKNSNPIFAVHDPATWPEQALLAHEQRWDELKTMQASLKAGKKK